MLRHYLMNWKLHVWEMYSWKIIKSKGNIKRWHKSWTGEVKLKWVNSEDLTKAPFIEQEELLRKKK